MANIKITDLTAYTDPASTDVLPIVDVGSNVTKKVSIADLLENAGPGTEALPGIAFDGDPNTGIYSPGTDQVAISTNGTLRLSIGSTGLHTITGPNNAAAVQIRDASNYAGQIITATDGTFHINARTTTIFSRTGSKTESLRITSAGTLMHLGAGDSTTPAVQFNGSAPANSLVMLSDGKVGLGTSNPDGTLHVQGSNSGATLEALVLRNNNTTSGTAAAIRFTNSTSAYNHASIIGGRVGGGNLDFYTAASANPAVRIDASGNVGIGTTSPSETLTLNGAAGASLGFEYGGSEVATIANNNAALYVTAGSGKLLSLGADGSEKARIDTFGKFIVKGVGTEAFSVDGGAPNNSLIVDSSGRCLVGTSTNLGNALLQIQDNAAGSDKAASIILSRGRTTFSANQDIGSIDFTDGSGNIYTQILAEADGTSGTDDYPGRLVFFTNPGSPATGPTERMRITSDAYVRLASGTGGIQFNGDTAAANALDDYEEGTWTPGITGTSGGSGQTYTTQTGTYVKIGDLVTVFFALTLSAKGTISNLPVITGLPFTGSASGSTSGLNYSALNITVENVGCSIRPGGFGQAYLRKIVSGTYSFFASGNGDLTDTSSFSGQFSYRASA